MISTFVWKILDNVVVANKLKWNKIYLFSYMKILYQFRYVFLKNWRTYSSKIYKKLNLVKKILTWFYVKKIIKIVTKGTERIHNKILLSNIIGKASPLAKELFQFPFVKEVFIDENYISTKRKLYWTHASNSSITLPHTPMHPSSIVQATWFLP